MAEHKKFSYKSKTDSPKFTSKVSYCNGVLKACYAFDLEGNRVNIFDGCTPSLDEQGKFNGYVDEKGRKIVAQMGDMITVGALDENGKMDKNARKFYSIKYFEFLCEQQKKEDNAFLRQQKNNQGR